MSSCDSFTENAWRPDLCSTCQRSKVEHEIHPSGSRSWRRRSEPDPNNAIAGVRISTLASKFQGREIRSGSLTETGKGREDITQVQKIVISHESKTSKEKQSKPAVTSRLNGSRSADLLDNISSSTSFPPQSSSSGAGSSFSSTITVTKKVAVSSSSSAASVVQSISSVSKSTSASNSSASPVSKSAIVSSASPHPNVTPKPSVSSKSGGVVSGGTSADSGAKPSSQKVESTSSTATASASVSATSASKTTKSQQHKPATTAKAETANKKSAKAASKNTTGESPASAKPKPNSNRPAQDQNDSVSKKTASAASSSSSTSKPAKPSVLKNTDSVEKEEKEKKSTSGTRATSRRRVLISKKEPEVIGNDGGWDSLNLDEEVPINESEEGAIDVIYPSLTEEEKKFALLALGNTVWNSDTRNLQVDIDSEKRYCREFEDVEVESLWKSGRFKTLVDCDATSCKRRVPGTFPQISGGKPKVLSASKISIQSIGKASGVNMRKGSTGDSGKWQQDPGHHASSVERLRSSASSATSGNSSMTSLSSDTDGRGNSYGSSNGSADSGVEMSAGADHQSNKERPLSYTLGDITDCLYETVDEVMTPAEGKGKVKVERTVSDDANRGRDNSKERPFVRARPSKGASLPEKSSTVDNDEMSTSMMSFPDKMEKLDLSLTESTLEGFQAIALLNDVLRDYGDLNESSTDDVVEGGKDTSTSSATKKETPKAKKKSDFEARMASVAANLDLTKQQRAKRQAPRPPVSPPPEPNMSVAQGVSPKKVVNQPDPVFKMVPVGKPIVTMPPQSDVPKQSKSQAPAGLEEFVSAENNESVSSKSSGEGGKSKKGITGFFKNILRREKKDSQESFESLNPDIQLSSKTDVKDSATSANNGAGVDGDDSNLSPPPMERKSGPKFPQGKHLVKPPNATSSPSKKSADHVIPSDDMPDSSTSSQPPSNGTKAAGTEVAQQSSQQAVTAATVGVIQASVTSPAVSSSPPTQKKSGGKGLSSPKMMLKRATAKFSPPNSRHKGTDKESTNQTPAVTTSSLVTSSSVTSSPSAASSSKPYPAPKPALPPPTKLSASTSPAPTGTPSSVTTPAGKDATTAKETAPGQAPNVVRRRAKSPKRNAPPVPPTRMAGGMPGGKPGDTKGNADIAKELERKLSKGGLEQQSGGSATLNRGELRDSTRRSMPVPPPSPPRDKSATGAAAGRSSSPSPPVSPIKETENSLPSSPSSPTTFDFPNNQWSGGSTSTIDEEPPKFTEKIELPTVANQGRKGILGKLSGVNRKTKAPQPPSVKRAKSITESSTLPRGDKKNKRINVADISGPVMVTDITNNSVLENRRNTISLGDDPSFALASLPTSPHTGGVSTSSAEKGGFDEFDFPVLSPLGSLENLYESIMPKPEGSSFHYYDPPSSPKVLCPNIPADGYLEPVPPASLLAASTSSATAPTNSEATTTVAAAETNQDTFVLSASSSTITTTITTTSTLGFLSADTSGIAPSMSSSSSSSFASASSMTSTTVVKSPSKSDPLVRKNKNSKSLDNVFDSHDPTKPSSHTSSESNSAENSGGSLPDSFLQSRSGLEAGASNVGVTFVEPEMTAERRTLLSSQPIYEEIPNGFNEEEGEEELVMTKSKKEGGAEKKKKGKSKGGDSHTKSKKSGDSSMTASFHGVALPGMTPKSAESMTKSQMAHAWLQQPPPPPLPPPSSSATLPVSPSKLGRHASSSSLLSTSTIMSTSLTSSMLPPPPPPPDQLSIPSSSTTRSISRETVSSESDIQSNCSTLPRPRAAPRRRAKRPDTAGSDQYVSMSKPNLQVSLGEDKLRDMLSRLSTITFHSLQEIYAQCEKILSVDQLIVPNPHQLKWSDFDIYGQPLHASGRCVVYNAKLITTGSPCQLMILHSRPATEMCHTSHPSLLRPSAVFADTIPFSFLTGDFIKTSQLLQNSIYDSTQARCFVAVGAFDIMESLDSHLSLLRETMAADPNSYLNIILTAALQLLSAMSHCLDQGFSVTETDYNDVFLITRNDLRGKVVAFLPHQRSLDVPQGEAMCNFLDGLLVDAFSHGEEEDEDDDFDEVEEDDGERIISSPKKVIAKLRSMLEAKRVESLGQVRTAIEYLLWGPSRSDLPLSPGGRATLGSATGTGGGTSKEQELYIWLEVQRTQTVGKLACSVGGLSGGLTLEDFYTLKFLLKTSALCLTESLRRLVR